MSKFLSIQDNNKHFRFKHACTENIKDIALTIGIYSECIGGSVHLTKDQVLQVINALQEMISDECKENGV